MLADDVGWLHTLHPTQALVDAWRTDPRSRLRIQQACEMNVLISSAGAKVLLVRSFQQAIASFGGKVVACDSDGASAALFIADDGFVVPPSDSADFWPVIQAICDDQRIGLLVPTRDGELEGFAAESARFREIGTEVLVASPGSVRSCLDKRMFLELCRDRGFPVARAYSRANPPLAFPVFARPVRGSGGRNARAISDADQLHALYGDGTDFIVQDFIDAPEYTVDVLMSMSGKPVQAVARRRISIRAGESVVSRVEQVPVLVDLALQVCTALRLCGHNVVQAFHSDTSGPLLIEVNPRFGGASNLSIVAGLDSPRRIIQMLHGMQSEAAAPRRIRQDLVMLRFADDLIVEHLQLESIRGHAAPGQA